MRTSKSNERKPLASSEIYHKFCFKNFTCEESSHFHNLKEATSSPENILLSGKIVTDDGIVFIPLNILRIYSPLMNTILASQQTSTIIIPGTDEFSVTSLMALLSTGYVKCSNERLPNLKELKAVAQRLLINIKNLEIEEKDFKELKGGKCSINDKIDVKIKTEEKHSAGSLTIIEKLKNEINKELEESKENDFDEKGYRCELCNNIHLSESMQLHLTEVLKLASDNPNKLDCPVENCKFVCSKMRQLFEHIYLDHSNFDHLLNFALTLKNKRFNDPIFVCTLCNTRCSKDMKYLIGHSFKHHKAWNIETLQTMIKMIMRNRKETLRCPETIMDG